MKKIATFTLGILIIQLNAWAQTESTKTESTGLTSSDVAEMKKTLEAVGDLSGIQIKYEDLYEPGDMEALAKGEQAVAKVIQDSISDMATMHLLAVELKLSLDRHQFKSQNNASKNMDRHVLSLYQVYSELFETTYHRMIQRLVSGNRTGEQSLGAAMGACKTRVCVSELSASMYELSEFGSSLNQDWDFDDFSSLKISYHFRTNYIRKSIKKIVDERLPINELTKGYDYAFQLATIPFAYAAANLADFGVKLKDVFQNLGVTRLKLFAHQYPYEANVSAKQLRLKRESWHQQQVQSIDEISEKFLKSVSGLRSASGSSGTVQITIKTKSGKLEPVNSMGIPYALEEASHGFLVSKSAYDRNRIIRAINQYGFDLKEGQSTKVDDFIWYSYDQLDDDSQKSFVCFQVNSDAPNTLSELLSSKDLKWKKIAEKINKPIFSADKVYEAERTAEHMLKTYQCFRPFENSYFVLTVAFRSDALKRIFPVVFLGTFYKGFHSTLPKLDEGYIFY